VKRGALALLCVRTRVLAPRRVFAVCAVNCCHLPAIGPLLVCVPCSQHVVENGERWMDDTYTVWSPLECKNKNPAFCPPSCSFSLLCYCNGKLVNPAAASCKLDLVFKHIGARKACKQDRSSSRTNVPILVASRENPTEFHFI
jgi:hypothetical protein